MNLCIGIPSGGTIKVPTISCLIDAFAHLPFEKHLSMPYGGYSAHNRNLIIKNALSHKATHLMMIDADMVFPPDAIKKLIDHDKDIIGANYNERKFPLTSTIKFSDATGKLIAKSGEEIPKKLFTCHTVPTGFLLIKMDVLKQFKEPYFASPEVDGVLHTEDFYFCSQAFKLGIKVWCDPTIIVKHVGEYLY